MTPKEKHFLESIIRNLEKISECAKISGAQREKVEAKKNSSIRQIKNEVEISKMKEKQYVSALLDGILYYGLTIDETVEMLKRLHKII